MLYLLDANTLIDANRDYYGINQVNEYWEWLVYCGKQGSVKIPLEIYEELQAGQDLLSKWAKSDEVKNALKLDEEVDIEILQRVINEGYARDLTDTEVVEIGRDPFLITYAAIQPSTRKVVTTERSKPKAQRQNRKVPDVCDQFSVEALDAFDFGHQLGFRTDWRTACQ